MIIKDGFTGLSSGTGFVTFIDVEDGQDAIKHLHNFDLGGLILKLGVLHFIFIRTCTVEFHYIGRFYSFDFKQKSGVVERY